MLNKTSVYLEKISIILKRLSMAKKEAHTPAGKRVEQLRKYLGLSYTDIAMELGKKTGQSFYDIVSGRHGISLDLAVAISERWPEIRKEWLMFGDGSMVAAAEPSGDGEGSVTLNAEVWAEMKKMISTLQSQQDTIRMLSEAVARGGDGLVLPGDAGCADAV